MSFDETEVVFMVGFGLAVAGAWLVFGPVAAGWVLLGGALALWFLAGVGWVLRIVRNVRASRLRRDARGRVDRG